MAGLYRHSISYICLGQSHDAGTLHGARLTSIDVVYLQRTQT